MTELFEHSPNSNEENNTFEETKSKTDVVNSGQEISINTETLAQFRMLEEVNNIEPPLQYPIPDGNVNSAFDSGESNKLLKDLLVILVIR